MMCFYNYSCKSKKRKRNNHKFWVKKCVRKVIFVDFLVQSCYLYIKYVYLCDEK